MNTNCTTCIEEYEPLEEHLLNGRFSQAQEFLATLTSKGSCFKTWEAHRLMSRAIANKFQDTAYVEELEQMQLKFFKDCDLSSFTQEQLIYGNEKTAPYLVKRALEKKKLEKAAEENAKRFKRKSTMDELEDIIADKF